MTKQARAVLLDTCAAIWLANADMMRDAAMALIREAGAGPGIFVSPITAWEIGLLSRPRAGREPYFTFLPDPKSWFSRLMAQPGLKPVGFTPDIAIDASLLPGELHGDPADRLMIATARHLQVPLVTRDSKIIAYAAAGHVEVLHC